MTVSNRAMNPLVAAAFLPLVAFLRQRGAFRLYGPVAIGAWFFFYRSQEASSIHVLHLARGHDSTNAPRACHLRT